MPKWSDTYSVKVPAFDQDHKKLFAYVDELNDAMRQGKGDTVIADILNRAHLYTVQHFSREEFWMSSHGVPQLAEHKALHQKFVNDLEKLAQSHKNGSLMISVQTCRFLNNWLSDHILGADQKYACYA